MSFYGTRWAFDGVKAGIVMRGVLNGHYFVVFEREFAELSQIESINWDRPVIEHLDLRREDEFGLPEGYGFDVVNITYESKTRSYTVELKTAHQYLGDVTSYQAQISDLENQVAEAKNQAAEATTQAETAKAQAEEAKTQAAEAQAKAEAAETSAAEKDATITAQAQEIENLKAGGDTGVVESLQAAYQEGVESNG